MTYGSDKRSKRVVKLRIRDSRAKTVVKRPDCNTIRERRESISRVSPKHELALAWRS